MASSEARGIDPKRLAGVVLSAAVRAQAETVYIEPTTEDMYSFSFERGGKTITTVSVESLTGAATIARLAYIANLDLAAASSTSAVTKVRSGDRVAEVVITIRPGTGLRAEIVVMPARTGRARTAPPVAVGTIGDIVGNYRIVEPLGEGGMGTVYRVDHIALGRSYALKALRPRVFEKDPTASQRFLREARAAARVRHPNIGDVFDFGHLADGRPYFVMELLAGESLADRVAREALQPAEVVAIARQLGAALATVHDHGVVHADVTPSNALVIADDPLHVKLIDFGLAAIAGEGIPESDGEYVLGTPSYISPEQLRGLPATDRSDQYGLGAVLYELVTGHPPYVHSDLRELCMMHIQAPIPLVESPYGPLPPKLADVITTCLQKSPQQRFPGMRAMLAALEEIDRGARQRGWRKWLG